MPGTTVVTASRRWPRPPAPPPVAEAAPRPCADSSTGSRAVTASMRTLLNLFVTRRATLLPGRNTRPDPTKCCPPRFPDMDEQHTVGRRLVVVGGGMVAHRLVEALTDRDLDGAWQVDVFAEESRPPYDRV